MPEEQSTHYLRISSCLQTILDLEKEIERLELGQALLEEFKVLKSFLSSLEKVRVNEEDVQRIEIATANFLAELEEPLARENGGEARARRLQ